MCARVFVYLCMKAVSATCTVMVPQTLLPYRKLDYAWSEPMLTKELSVHVVASGTVVHIGDFALDKIGSVVLPPLRRIGYKVRFVCVHRYDSVNSCVCVCMCSVHSPSV